MNLFSGSNRHPIISNMTDEELWEFKMNPSTESLVKYFDDITEEVLHQEFNFKKCPNKHIWYGEWENHRRLVVKLNKFYSYEVMFGYNYDFIPKFNPYRKLGYLRTDKSVDVQVRDYYYYHVMDKFENLTQIEDYLLTSRYELSEYGCCENMEKVFGYLRNVIQTNIPIMKDFFRIYQNDKEVISFIDYVIDNGNPFRIYPELWAKAFLLAKFHEMDDAVKTMEIVYRSSVIPETVIAKLDEVNNMY